jgi:ketosteroid isomerase-like protein
MRLFKLIAGLCATVFFGVAHAAAASDVADLKKQVVETERAFAATMKNRDFAGFNSFVSEEAVFFSGPTPLHGKQAVSNWWKKYYDKPDAPFSWAPDEKEVEVLASGTLAISGGPVYDAQGTMFSRFSSIWRLEAPGKWRIIFDHGWPLPGNKKP